MAAVHPACAAGTLWANPNVLQAGGPGPFTTFYLPVNTSRNPFLQVSLIVRPPAGQATASDFDVQLWSRSGRSPGVREVLLATMHGAITPERQTILSFNAFAMLPNAGRPFDPTQDSFELTFTQWKPVNDDGQLLSVSASLCNTTTGGADCCAETIALLQEILSSVSRVWPVVPDGN
jgi:hypothetical protein